MNKKTSRIIVIVVLLIVAIGMLSACAEHNGEQENSKQEMSNETDSTQIINEETEINNDETESVEPTQQDEELSTSDNNTSDLQEVVYDDDTLYMSLELPQGWTYEIISAEEEAKTDSLYVCKINFWNSEYPEDIFVLGYQTQFGMCGTGVEIEEITLENGMTGWRYTETIEDDIWMTITLNNPDNVLQGGTYLLNVNLSESDWNNLKSEFEEILQSIIVGE